MLQIEHSILDQVQPVVLVGGRSSRFGRDKLLEPVDGTALVGVVIDALRSVFGGRVAVVGRCDPRIEELADVAIDDPYPGLGPVGGICAALEFSKLDVFVCAGDLVSIDAETIRMIVAASVEEKKALAYLADDGRVHPTVGLYRAGCVSAFREAIEQDTLKLGAVLDPNRVCRVAVDSARVRNVNRPEDLDGDR